MSDISSGSVPEAPNSVPTPDQVKSDLDNARGTLSAAAGELGAAAQAELAGAKEAAAAQIADATEKAKSFAAEHKDVAAQQVGGVSTALSKVADELAADEQTAPVADYARALAGGAQQVSDALRNNSIEDLIGMAQDFGRRQPVAFLGAAALAGFVASRFVVASAGRRRPGTGPSTPAGALADTDVASAGGDFAGDGSRDETSNTGALE